MAWTKRMSSAAKGARVAIAAMALLGGIGIAAPASAGAATPKIESADTVQASWSCSYTQDYYRIDANCTVYSGYIRLRSYCNGYGYIATVYVGAGSWYLWNNCYPYQRTASYIDYYG
jgi:hypothetical protein